MGKYMDALEQEDMRYDVDNNNAEALEQALIQ
jgi:hypothetical protein